MSNKADDDKNKQTPSQATESSNSETATNAARDAARTEGGKSGGSGSGGSSATTQAGGSRSDDWDQFTSSVRQGYDAASPYVSEGASAVSTAASAIQTGAEVLSNLADNLRATLPIVEYSFHASQTDGSDWKVKSVHIEEGISEIYKVTLELTSEDITADVGTLRGANCDLTIRRDPVDRRIRGIVHRATYLRRSEEHGHAKLTTARVEIRPGIAAMDQRVNSRVYQDMNVREIVDAVLADWLQPLDREVNWNLNGTYPKREYTIQYAETDLEFVRRILADEGIMFFFDHGGEKESLIIVDANEPCQPVETRDEGSVRLYERDIETAAAETVRNFHWEYLNQTTSVVWRDYDWSRPALDITRESRGQDYRSRDREEFEFTALTIGHYQEDSYSEEDGRRRAGIRHDEYKQREETGVGNGNVITFGAGTTFTLAAHPIEEQNRDYLITRVTHTGIAQEHGVLHTGILHDAVAGTTHDQRVARQRERYDNRFECIPKTVSFRPPHRVKRRMPGPQTAKVVGPSGDEIHTDKHGRIKIQFHWDRRGNHDEQASCYVRVKQAWAGQGWGAVVIPRIGMEVVVDFLEGDPDRPLVTGCVFNGDHRPPHLPDHPTRSTFRTNSSPGGTGFNELYFEDNANQEVIYLHAQKDLTEKVLNDHSTDVGNDQTNHVGHDQTETVDNDQTLHVKVDRKKTVDGDETTTVHGSREENVDQNETITIGQDRKERVVGNETISVAGKRTETVGGLEQITLQNDRVTDVTGNDRLAIHGSRTEHVAVDSAVITDGQHKIQQGSTSLIFDGNQVSLSAGDQIRIQRGSTTITIAQNGAVTVQATAAVRVRGGDCEMRMDSGQLSLQANSGILLMVGASTVSLSSSGINASGTSITSSATGINSVLGSVVKVNS